MNDTGTYRRYEPEKKLGKETEFFIGHCNKIIAEYESKGHMLTVRQIFYQCVARGITGGENSLRMYNKIQSALNVGRMQGLVSWTAIEDRERSLMGLDYYESVVELLKTARNSFRLDLWHNQAFRPEVWVEKKALVGVIGNICNRLRVNFFACKGYNSQSEQWAAGRRFASYIQKGQRPIVFHLGDHDPSGIDMTRDNRDRLSVFAGVPIIVQRLALNMPQIEELNPPPNPAKLSDSRAEEYISRFGESSWELDALDPLYIENLIEQAILKIRDPDLWNDALAEENTDLNRLDVFMESFK